MMYTLSFAMHPLPSVTVATFMPNEWDMKVFTVSPLVHEYLAGHAIHSSAATLSLMLSPAHARIVSL